MLEFETRNTEKKNSPPPKDQPLNASFDSLGTIIGCRARSFYSSKSYITFARCSLPHTPTTSQKLYTWRTKRCSPSAP